MMKFTIEISERLGDYKPDGTPRFHAQIKDHPEIWDAGATPNEALACLIRSHAELFNIKVIKFIGKQSR